AFFLRGQQQGVFRIDITAQALTEIWASVLIGLLDGERRGRIARAGLAAMAERVFLQGAGVEAR
ncbi:transcriptional regulator, partial [Acinetobacter baumannii]